MNLNGKIYTRRQIEARVGRIEQLGGVRRMTLGEGHEAGVELLRVSTGAGLEYEVSPTKGLDLGPATFGGSALCWHGPAGQAHPAYLEPEDFGWHRTSSFGLMFTCGLDQVGAPGRRDDGIALPLHGRIHHVPARHVAAEGFWEGDEYEIRIRGTMEQVSFEGERLVLERELRSRLGENRIEVRDRVTNIGFAAQPHMILYHVNLGWPLLSEASTLEVTAGRVTPHGSADATQEWDRFDSPSPEDRTRVCYHEELEVEQRDGVPFATATLRQPAFPVGGVQRPLSLRVRWSADTLPILGQWRRPQSGTYVMGLEPTNCHIVGQAAAREQGILPMLQPGESRDYRLILELL